MRGRVDQPELLETLFQLLEEEGCVVVPMNEYGVPVPRGAAVVGAITLPMSWVTWIKRLWTSRGCLESHNHIWIVDETVVLRKTPTFDEFSLLVPLGDPMCIQKLLAGIHDPV